MISIVELRTSSGLGIRGAAKVVGISAKGFHAIETKKVAPHYSTILKISKAFGVLPGDIDYKQRITKSEI